MTSLAAAGDHLLKTGIRMLSRGSEGQWEERLLPPNGGRYAVSHQDTFMSKYSSLSEVYRDYDEALLNSRGNARYMLNDVGIRECLDTRQRSVCLLDWSLEAEDEKSDDQKAFCKLIETMMRRIRNFYEFRLSLQDAIWYGKAANILRWRVEEIKGKSYWIPKGLHRDDKGWRPLHGDKIVFRMDKPSYVPGAYEGQMGIRVGSYGYKTGDIVNNRWRVESTDYGLAYFLNPEERQTLFAVHKHHGKDAAFEDGLRAGSIHGVGIRSVIYWEWIQKQETQAFMMEFMERMAGGIQMWKYPQGNQKAEQEVIAAAKNYNGGKEHIMIVPVPVGEDARQYGVEVVEPGFQSIEVLHNLIKEYFNNRVKRYIIGQTLTSEAEATGLGSGVAELHLDTYLQIIKADAISHDESMTAELIRAIIDVNKMKGRFSDPGFTPRMVTKTEDDNMEQKLSSVVQLMDRKMKFRQSDLYQLVEMAQPDKSDAVNPDMDPPAMPGAMPGQPGQAGPPAGEPDTGKSGSPDAESDDDKPKGENEPRDKNAGHAGYSGEHIQRYGVN